MFKFLETYKVVYEELNFTVAAEKLFISQPTVSTQIHKLEEIVGAPLFVRNGRTEMSPTESGKLFYIQCKEMLELWEDSIHEVQSLKGILRTTCKLGASHTIAVHYLPAILKDIQEQFPLVDFEVYLSNSEDVLKKVETRMWDFGFIEAALTTTELERVPFLKDELVVAGKKEETLWLIREKGSGIHHFTMDYFDTYNIQPQQKMIIESNEMIIKLLEKGIGKTLISKQAVGNIPFESLKEPLERELYLIKPKQQNKVLQQVVEAFFNALNK